MECGNCADCVYLTGHGDDNSGDGKEGWGDEAEVFHLVGKVVVGVGLEEEGGGVPGGQLFNVKIFMIIVGNLFEP